MKFERRKHGTCSLCGKEGESPITFVSLFLPGQRIVVVRCEKINISGSFYRNKCKLMWAWPLGVWV